ncbi:hypothetical protein [Massilia sp. Dwa41.01b]|uniref:N-acyl amino acid synthase FeeM domain-containing protein n=1 Tax=Massilia sp. Dwa41.01b TaxID=2709302 RepID=UPI001603F4D8|nr:hypothetical protein [Massilia sp. Dwa41.01b]
MSLCLDMRGRLPADENFGDRLVLLRRQGRRLCEPSRLAIDPGMSRRVFAALIHISYLYANRLHGYTDYVIEVNPRHVAFYQRMLGFADFGGERPCSRVGAPAVLLRLPLDHMATQIALGRRCSRRRRRTFLLSLFLRPGGRARHRAPPGAPVCGMEEAA